MNYRTYKTLSQELKEEYDFKFKTVSVLNISSLTSSIVLAWSVMTNFIMMCFITMTNPVMESYKDQVPIWINILSQTGYFIAWFILLYAITHLINVIIYIIRYNMWLKQNKIKVIHWWTKE